jgi:hypothetical protein
MRIIFCNQFKHIESIFRGNISIEVLMNRMSGRDKQHFVKFKTLSDDLGVYKMPVMNRVKCSAK